MGRRRGEGGGRLFDQIDAGGGGDRGRGCHSRCAGPSPPPPPPPPASSPWSTAASTVARPALPLPCGRKLHSIRRKWSQHAFRGQRGAMDTDAADGGRRPHGPNERDGRAIEAQPSPSGRPAVARPLSPSVRLEVLRTTREGRREGSGRCQRRDDRDGHGLECRSAPSSPRLASPRSLFVRRWTIIRCAVFLRP